jgi:hypothetical protein
MALRVLLVAIVAALGLELPGADEFAGWERSGRDWVTARLADLSSLCFDEAPASEPTDAAPDRTDLVFEAVTESMALNFSSDLASNGSKPPVEGTLASIDPQAGHASSAQPDRADLVFEVVAESMASGFSSDLASIGTKPPGEGNLASIEPQAAPASAVAVAPAGAEASTPQELTLERLATAVRLTKQAVDAWASVIQPAADRVVVEDPVDSL